MGTFQDPYANADYIATLLSGQVSGGYLQKEPSEASHGFWKATSTNLGLNFSATAITGFSYTPNQSAGTVGRLQFSTDGSNSKAIDGSNINVGAYEFDLLEYINIPAASDINDMWNGGMTFSVWVRPEGVGGAGTRVWDKGGKFYFGLGAYSSEYHQTHWFCETDGADWNKTGSAYTVASDKWTHVAAKWAGSSADDPVIYVNGVSGDIVSQTAGGSPLTDAGSPLTMSSTGVAKNFVGSVSDLIFWRSELTDTQMKDIYLYSKIPAGFVARYRLADTTNVEGGVIIDDTTNNNGVLK